ncbi:MAG TPA: RagB/SusD family nutrient uptake outer membrane protein [Chitinophagaceae bacterium]|nr:RagB/SusD family nutrient uptake outer membrane protein [Chitinophagaceae bacterium]
MKKHLKYIISLGAGLMLFSTSCKRELLSPIPQTSVTDATAFDTPGRIANQVNSLYAAFKSGAFYGGRAQIAGDIRGEDFLNETTNGVTGFDVWLLNATGTSQNFVKNMWAQAYYVINLTNLFIDGMNAKGTTVVGDALSKNYVAEARLLRAASYLKLLEHYARPYADGAGSRPGLPLRLTGIKGSGFSPMARSTVAEVYAQILSDLNYAEANLPLNYATAALNTTRAHRNTAIALKTRVYLAMQDYGNVITEGNKIAPQATAPFSATSGVAHALAPDIVTVFRAPYTHVESILSMPMTSTAGDNPGTQNQLGFYWSRTTGGGEFSLNPSGIVGNTGWTAGDRRRTFNAVISGKTWLNTKFNTPSPYTDWAPVIRYSEVLLNLAEALARNDAGINAKAVALLNAVRQRSDASTVIVPATKTDLINAILTERRIEFLGEGLRNFDLMRLLQTIPAKGSAPAKAPGDGGYIWPISADEMSLNPLMVDN